MAPWGVVVARYSGSGGYRRNGELDSVVTARSGIARSAAGIVGDTTLFVGRAYMFRLGSCSLDIKDKRTGWQMLRNPTTSKGPSTWKSCSGHLRSSPLFSLLKLGRIGPATGTQVLALSITICSGLGFACDHPCNLASHEPASELHFKVQHHLPSASNIANTNKLLNSFPLRAIRNCRWISPCLP